MLRNDIVDLYHGLYGRRKPPCLSGAIYQRVAQAPPTALESAEVTGLVHHVRSPKSLMLSFHTLVFDVLLITSAIWLNRTAFPAFLKWTWR